VKKLIGRILGGIRQWKMRMDIKFLWPKYGYIPASKSTARECCECANQHSMNCPNSFDCYSTKSKPYFKRKKEAHHD
jgi:hypothetical protein